VQSIEAKALSQPQKASEVSLFPGSSWKREVLLHRIVWFGMDVKDHLVPTLAMTRDTFHYTRLL